MLDGNRVKWNLFFDANTIYTKLSIVPHKSRVFTLVVGDMISLKCLGNVDQVVSKSQTGLLIEL